MVNTEKIFVHFQVHFLKFVSQVWSVAFWFVTTLAECITGIINCFKSSNDAGNLPKYGGPFSTAYILMRQLYHKKNIKTTSVILEILNSAHSLSNGVGLLKITPLGLQIVCLSNVASAKVLLRCTENVTKSVIYKFLKPWLRNSLIIRDTPSWKVYRRLLAPTLYRKVVESYLPIFEEQSSILMNKLEDSKGKFINATSLFSYLSLAIVTETTMGVHLDIQNTEDSTYLKSLQMVNFCAIDRMFQPWHWMDSLYKRMPQGKMWSEALNYTRSFTMKIIEERLQKMKAMDPREASSLEECDILNRKRVSFLDKALELHLVDKNFGLYDIQNEVEGLLFGAHETIALNLTWTLYLLSQNKDALQKVHEEIDQVIPTQNEPITYEHLRNLRYLECAIKEAARIYTPAPIVSRVLDTNLTIGEYTIPKGTTCVVNSNCVHRDPAYYPEPELFRPERFMLSSNDPPLDPYALLLFSAGPRGCIASQFALMEIKLVLSRILSKFTVFSELPRDKIIMSIDLVQHPEKDVLLGFKLK